MAYSHMINNLIQMLTHRSKIGAPRFMWFNPSKREQFSKMIDEENNLQEHLSI